MAKIPLEVIAVEKMPLELIHEMISKEKKPPIMLECFLQSGKCVQVKILQESIECFSDFEEGKVKLSLKGKDGYIIVKGSAQELMTKIHRTNGKFFKNMYKELPERRVQVEMPEDLIGSLSPVTIRTLDGKLEKATKLFQKGTDEYYIIISGSAIDNLKKLCPTLNFSQLEG